MRRFTTMCLGFALVAGSTFALGSSAVVAAPVQEGKEWRELYETTGLSWAAIATVLSATEVWLVGRESGELVADRIERFASVVGRERVIAGTDCGFATARAGDEVHPDVAWAKLKALSEGAKKARTKAAVARVLRSFNKRRVPGSCYKFKANL